MKLKRCRWVDPASEIYLSHHDEEWGVPEHDDRKLFEMLILEGFQAGLSWITILKKREAFRKAFDIIIRSSQAKRVSPMKYRAIFSCPFRLYWQPSKRKHNEKRRCPFLNRPRLYGQHKKSPLAG